MCYGIVHISRSNQLDQQMSLHGMKTKLSEKRMKMKALLASSIGNSLPGHFTCNKCHIECGSEASLCNHVRLHSNVFVTCPHCGFKSDIHSERKTVTKTSKIKHGKKATTVVVVKTLKEDPKVIHHICHEGHLRRNVNDTASYRTTKS